MFSCGCLLLLIISYFFILPLLSDRGGGLLIAPVSRETDGFQNVELPYLTINWANRRVFIQNHILVTVMCSLHYLKDPLNTF